MLQKLLSAMAFGFAVWMGAGSASAADTQWSEFKAAHSGKCLDSPRVDRGVQVMQQDCNGGDNQKWKFDGLQIVEKKSGHCLDATGNVTGAKVSTDKCHGGRNQMWKFDNDGQIVNEDNGLCLDVYQASRDSNVGLVLWTCSHGANQRWAATISQNRGIAASDDRQWDELRVGHSKKCLDATTVENGATVVQQDCNGGDNQKWKISGRQIIEKKSGHCLDAKAAADGATITARNCNDGRSQMWTFRSDGRIVNDLDGRCVDVYGASQDSNTPVVTYTCKDGNNNTASNQRWDSMLKPSLWTDFRSEQFGTCLEASSRASGGAVVQNKCHGGDSQQWRIDGRQIIVKSTGFCLDVTSSSPGAKITAHECHGRANQTWHLTDAGELQNQGACAVVAGGSSSDGAAVVYGSCETGKLSYHRPGVVWKHRFKEERWLRIYEIRTRKPSNGIGDAARLMSEIAGFAVGAIIQEGVPIIGDAIVMFVEAGVAYATEERDADMGDLGEAVLENVDGLTAGSDELYIKVNGRKIAPMSDKYWSADSGHKQLLEGDAIFEIPLVRDVDIELFEWDNLSDDSLGGFTVVADHPDTDPKTTGRWAIVASTEHDSIHVIRYTIEKRYMD